MGGARTLLTLVVSAVLACGNAESESPTGAGGDTSDGGPGGASADTAVDECPPQVELDVDPNNCAACGHSCRGGVCLAGECQPVKVGSLPLNPIASAVGAMLAVDAQSVFVASARVEQSLIRVTVATGESATVAGSGDFVLARHPIVHGADLFFSAHVEGLAGTVFQAPTTLSSPPSPIRYNGTQEAVTFTVDNQSIYWVANGAIKRGPRGSRDEVSIVPLERGLNAVSLATNVDNLFAVTNRGLLSAPKIGTTTPRMIEATPIRGALAEGATSARLVAVDEDFVYWIGDAVLPSTALFRAALGAASTTETIATSSGNDRISGVAMDATRVYWVTQAAGGSSLHAFEKSSKRETRLFSMSGARVTDFVVEPDMLWFIVDNESSATVYRLAK